jgi:HPt (histidine-containing phosphotransfer) domain-containing protein
MAGMSSPSLDPAPGPAPLDPLDARTLRQLKDLGGDDDPDFLPSVLRSFLEHLGVAIADLEAAVARQDAASLKRVAHSLKGSAGNVGAKTLAARCADVERGALGGGDLASPLTDVRAEASRVRARVEAELRAGAGRG